MKKLSPMTAKPIFIAGLVTCLMLLLNACATFRKPETINEAPVHERALIKETGGIRASVAVVGDEEARQIFGINLARTKIQAVWVKIENNIDRPLVLLPTAIDPEYFAPLEVAFAYHKFLATDANATLAGPTGVVWTCVRTPSARSPLLPQPQQYVAPPLPTPQVLKPPAETDSSPSVPATTTGAKALVCVASPIWP